MTIKKRNMLQYDLFDTVAYDEVANNYTYPDVPSDDEDDVISSWSYGVVELDNGDLVLAEIFWDEREEPLAWTEAHMVFDADEGIEGLTDALRNALNDIEADPTPIKESYFKGNH